MLRKQVVVGKSVEFFGPGLDYLSVADKATIGNMAPEYGATCGFFPVDAETIDYLKTSGRSPARVALVTAYAKAQGLFRTAKSPDPVFTETLTLDLGDVVPSMAGPKRPEGRVALPAVAEGFATALTSEYKKGADASKRYPVGNRNFEGRVSPDVQANYLASPPLVVAYALAGTVTKNLAVEPISNGRDGKPVYLKDIWPTTKEINAIMKKYVTSAIFKKRYADVFKGDTNWRKIKTVESETYRWNMSSTYVQNPPYFEGMKKQPEPIVDVVDARILAMFGDKITTDHISPAGAVKLTSPAGEYLLEHQGRPADFNQYCTRRGHHEVMMRGTFANIRIKNFMLRGADGNIPEGGLTRHWPDGEQMSIYDAAMKYQAQRG